MAKINKRIEIAASSLPGLHSMAPQTTMMIKKVLEKYFTNVSITIINSLKDLEQLAERQPDLVFVGMKRLRLRKQSAESNKYIEVSGFLEDRNVSVTGSSSNAIELDRDKTKAKDVVSAAGLATSPYFIAKNDKCIGESQLPFDFPMFLKPPNRGNGIGIGNNSVVQNFNEFEAKVKSLAVDLNSETLVEKYLSGREFTVAILQDSENDELLVMPVEIIPRLNSNGNRILSRREKHDDEEEVVKIHDQKLKNVISTFAKDTFMALGARDYGRIDIRLDENNEPSFLEANLVPGLRGGYFSRAVKMNSNQNYKDMILHIANLAFSH